jgi:hypothetical protein
VLKNHITLAICLISLCILWDSRTHARLARTARLGFAAAVPLLWNELDDLGCLFDLIPKGQFSEPPYIRFEVRIQLPGTRLVANEIVHAIDMHRLPFYFSRRPTVYDLASTPPTSNR